MLVWKEGILRKSDSIWHRKPWLITSVHTNGTITIQRRNKLEWMNIRRVKPFVENLDNKLIIKSKLTRLILHSHKLLQLRLLVTRLTTRVTSQALIRETIFLPIWFFPSLSHADSSFVGASDVSRLERYRTNILLVCLTKVRC